eukprot:5676428-Pleurochrysis_carterae.AAC.2
MRTCEYVSVLRYGRALSRMRLHLRLMLSRPSSRAFTLDEFWRLRARRSPRARASTFTFVDPQRLPLYHARMPT